MKIILATGIFYPDVGGPAIHVRKIAEALIKKGHQPIVLTYSEKGSIDDNFGFKTIRISRHLPKPIRLSIYGALLFLNAINAQIIYAFNVSTSGILAFVVGKILRKKLFIRVPGDPIWERTVEKGKRQITFIDYYTQGLYKIDRPWLFWMIRFILSRFDRVVFYSDFLSDVYKKYYAISDDKIIIIPNPISNDSAITTQKSAKPTILFAGRFVAYKNLPTVLKVFDELWRETPAIELLLIGDGPDKEKIMEYSKSLPSSSHITILPKMNQEKLFEYIKQSWIGIGPALTEFNPNFILECLSFSKPVLVSKENGLSVKLPEQFLWDPHNKSELKTKLKYLLNEKSYQEAEVVVSGISKTITWETVIRTHMDLLHV